MADLYTGGATVSGTIAYFTSFAEILVADGDSASPVSIELTDSGTIDMTDLLDTRAVTLQAFSGDDRITTTTGDDLIMGAEGNDTISSTGGNDTLIGGAGDDSLVGGGGADSFVVTDETSGRDIYLGGSGLDEFRIDAASELHLDWLVLSAASGIEVLNLNGVGLGGTDGADYFDISGVSAYLGGAGLVMGDGNDTVRGASVADDITGGAGDDSLSGNNGDDTLTGGLGNDVLNGGAGNDSLVLGDAEPGRDTLQGGTGTDTVVLDLAVTTLGRLVLNAAASIEVLAATDALAMAGTGNDFWDISGVSSYAAALQIDLGAGNDSLLGTAVGDQVDGGENNDTLSGNGGNDALAGGNGNDALSGGADDDTLTGGAGNDALDGGTGNDVLTGGAGDDGYVVGLGDQVSETTLGGHDRITLQGLASYVLGSNIEDLAATGAQAATLIGNRLDNTISGGSGNDSLNGKIGADTLIGGHGDDVYWLDDAGDVVVEARGDGADTIRTGLASYDLGDNVETLVGTNRAGQALTGNAAANTLIGAAGADTLAGGAGADTLKGGAGGDSYLVANAGDLVVERLGQGADTVTTALAAYTLTANVETLIGNREGRQTLTGNALNNHITAGAGADHLSGMAGNDWLTGGAGADRFEFSAALSAGNRDHITDFAAEDSIVLENTGAGRFNALTAGHLDATAFKIIGALGGPVDADDHVLYDQATGRLYYDGDGAGGAARVQFAVLTAGTVLTVADFLVI